MRSGFHHKDAAASPWSLHTRPESEPTPRCATRPVARHSTLRLGLMLHNHYPDILHQFVFEFVFCKQHLMRQQRMCGSRGDPGAVGLTRTRAHVRACGPSRRHAERTARPRPELRPVTAARPQPPKSERLLVEAAAGPRQEASVPFQPPSPALQHPHR